MAESDAFEKKVTAELRDLERREQKLHRDQEGIRDQLVKLRQRRTELDQSLGVYRDVMGVGQEGAATSGAAEGTIADVALKVLTERGAPMAVGELVIELRALGKLRGGGKTGRADYATVYSAIRRNDRFVKGDDGRFSPATSASEPERPA